MDQFLPLPLEQFARAADLCLAPWLHAVRASQDDHQGDVGDCTLVIEARDTRGERHANRDLELEIYRSGRSIHLMLTKLGDEQAPLLWHGAHAVWLCAESGERCERPADGAAMEALCRRVRALLAGNQSPG